MEETLAWIEKHPAISAVIGVGGAILILYLFGFFSSNQQSGNSGQSNLAAAYYAAEAAQATAGTQLQLATVQATNQTAQVQAQANAATAIAQTQADMYTTLGSQTATANQTLYNDELLSSISSNNDAMNTANTAAMYNYSATIAGQQAGIWNNYINTVLSTELATYGGSGTFVVPTLVGAQSTFNVTAPGAPTPASQAVQGFG